MYLSCHDLLTSWLTEPCFLKDSLVVSVWFLEDGELFVLCQHITEDVEEDVNMVLLENQRWTETDWAITTPSQKNTCQWKKMLRYRPILITTDYLFFTINRHSSEKHHHFGWIYKHFRSLRSNNIIGLLEVKTSSIILFEFTK